MANDAAIIHQGRVAFMLGRGLQWNFEKNVWRVLDAENPFATKREQHLWDIGYRQRRDEFFRLDRKGGNHERQQNRHR